MNTVVGKDEIDKPYAARHRIGLVLGPLLFILFIILPDSFLAREARCVAATAVLMAVWWICESIPLAATALIPLVAFPVMKVTPAREVAASYASPEIFLFMGGFFLAVAIQRWGLHRRIALAIVSLVGCRGERIILGFMIATAFLSMWISNTATTMMMLPIGLAVLVTLEDRLSSSGGGGGYGEGATGPSSGPGGSTGDFTGPAGGRPFDAFKMALMLSIAYAANIGGIGTLIGTPPNIVFAAQVRALVPGAQEVTFTRWMLVGLPLVAIFIPLTWLILTRVTMKGTGIDLAGGHEAIAEERQKLGPMNRGEKRTLVIFLLTVAAWITRGDIRIGDFTLHGWASLTSLGSYVHDSTIAIAAALALFLTPVNYGEGQFVLNWRSASRIPWGILILFGGGIALGRGFTSSHLAARIAHSMELLSAAPVLVLVALTALVVTFLTEITSNTAVATIFLPILAATATGLGVHPFVLMIPATISASCAFMLPVATPPNAIVFSSGNIPMSGMVRVGVIMNLVGVVLVVSLMYLIAMRVFGVPVAW